MQKSFVRTGDVNVKQRTVCNAKIQDVQQIYFNCQAFIQKREHKRLLIDNIGNIALI